MRTASGYPVLTDEDSDSDMVFEALKVGEENIGEVKECVNEFHGKDVSRL